MLVMRRRAGESILIGEGVEIRILSIDRTRVKFGITAPRSVPVVARELDLVRKENLAAAQAPPEAAVALAHALRSFMTPEPQPARTSSNPAGTAGPISEEGLPCRSRH
jgi:carbon storage regulator